MKYQVSLIIPVYKTENFIEKCLLSVCNQTLDQFQIIIIDDCSPDESLRIAKQILQQYPDREKDTKIVSFDKNQGISYVRKYALNIAEGKYVASLDSDDFLELDALESMLSFANINSLDIVFSDYYINTKNSIKQVKQKPIGDKLNVISQLLDNELHGSLCNKLFNIDILKKVLILENVNISEDLLICIQAVYFSNNIAYIPKAYLHYVKYNSNSYTTNFSERKLSEMIMGVNFLDDFFSNKNINENIKEAFFYRKCIIKSDVLTYSSRKTRGNYIELYNDDLSFAKIEHKLNIYKRVLFFLLRNNFFVFMDFFIGFRNSLSKIRSKLK
ncbi:MULTISPECIES: glycosyltransferase family 2 protein [Acinetobacter]|uniref:Glycosyltransferase 2-like domain-containing protein n=1 Tax=Acinetobacter higginsii TaxID=70347 RepID=N9TDZ9_9GAMM|nr:MULTISPECIES: glycosyltransferase family 2 protein [Acinetobacter]ENX61610.1 hypothetical protein F902_00647 [Acinetobacter higginsii]